VISGATRVAAVIGDPVRHSLSPILHNTAYRELGLDWSYVAFEVPDGQTAAALQGARALGLVGLSVTMPHKTAAAAACDELTDDAAALRSVNTVMIEDAKLLGASTDGPGFLRSLADAGCDPTGARVLVVGAGGAARAVALALGRAAAHLQVAARRPAAAAETAELAGGEAVAWDDRAAAAIDAGIVVNATPVGMGDDPAVVVAVDALHPGQVVADLVYHPLETPLLREARARGATTVDGLGMLVHQAALQVERWSGQAAPVPAMRRAAEAALRSS
jgi:shikimate dehydrogenase